MPQPNDPRMAQWQQRFNAASAAVKAAEQSRDPQRVRQAYEQLRQVQSVRPTGGNPTAKGKTGPANAPAPAPKPKNVGGVFNYIKNAMAGAN